MTMMNPHDTTTMRASSSSIERGQKKSNLTRNNSGGSGSKRRTWNPFSSRSSEKSAGRSKGDEESSLASTSTNNSVPNPQDCAQDNSAPTSSSAPFKKVGVLTADDYGYGDATPEEDYGYGDAPPSVATSDPYGYGDASPEEPAQPRRRRERRCSMPVTSSSSAMPRRSSMRPEGAPRRESITHRGEVEVVLPPSQKGQGRQRIKRRTSLTFNEQATVTPIEPAKSLAGGKEDLWFQRDEMDAIRKKVVALVNKTSDGKAAHSGRRYCVRGLERLIDPETAQIKRGQAWDAVFNEQYLQRNEGVFEEDHLANLYKFSTLRSAKDAALRASEDQKEVEAYLNETRRMCRRMSM